jgi:hypothetical protein
MSDKPTEDSTPMWRTTRVTALRSCAVEAGYTFSGNPNALGMRFGDYEPANKAAERWRSTDLRGPERPRWRALRRIVVDGRVVREGEDFFSLAWPTNDWAPLNSPAQQVATSQRETEGKPRPAAAWSSDGLNTSEAESAREAERVRRSRPAAPPPWPFSTPRPPSARWR